MTFNHLMLKLLLRQFFRNRIIGHPPPFAVIPSNNAVIPSLRGISLECHHLEILLFVLDDNKK